MGKNQRVNPQMRSTYYLAPGQTLKNTKISERVMMLLAPKSEFQRLVDYTNEPERMAIIAAKEAAKLAAIKKATHEMSKTWDNTFENIKRRRDEELWAKRRQEEEDRVQFVKDMAAKNAKDRAEIVKEARRLLLYKKPQCRLINGALLTSECYRERDEQVAFEKLLKGVDEERDKEYAEFLREDAASFFEEERAKAVEKWKKDRAHGDELKKQIDESNRVKKLEEKEELAAGKQDLLNMSRDLRLIAECETEQVLKRKKEINDMAKDAIEQRRCYMMELKRKEEFEDRALEIFERSKKRIQMMKKQKDEEELKESRRHAEYIANKCAVATKSRLGAEEESMRRAMEEKEAEELAKIEARRKIDADIKAECIQGMVDAKAAKERRKYEERELNNWETQQRFKRDEYNKEVEVEERKRQWAKKMITAEGLRNQIAEIEKDRAREKKYEVESTKAIIEKTNRKVLEYGAQVLEESRGIRPLFPIIKTIEQYKRENGLIPRKQCEDSRDQTPVARRQRKRNPICSNPPAEQDIVYL